MDTGVVRSRWRRSVAAGAAAVACLVLLTGCLAPSQTSVLNALNRDRAANRLAALKTQNDAQNKAQAWAENLASKGTLYHSNLTDGIKVRWCSLGENVGMGPTIDAVEQAYMGSPPHRANILGTTWNGVGVGYATSNGLVYTVQVFIRTC